jgi:beta-glucosidase
VADIDALLGELTLDEKAALTAGGGMMSTAPVPRLGIPTVSVTDGPSGARGPNYPGMAGPTSSCIPCGSAIGASWDPVLAQALGSIVGREALERGCRGLLAPTVNLHRSPLAGRNFESYSEDPLLSGRLAAGYIRGVQANGVFATVKHFVANDAEHERMTIDSVVDERPLRELYLLPFELAVREGGVQAVMTSYNRVNGRWVTEQPELLIDLLRTEWGFDGLVMTDWFAVVDTTTSLAAGLDLEMPGEGRAFGPAVAAAVRAGTVDEKDLDAGVRRLLHGLDRAGALGPEPPVDPKPTTAEDAALLRRAAAEATVLLTNDGTLPLDAGALRRVAVIGPNAAAPGVNGGGSAQVNLLPLTAPVDALRDALDGVEVVHERGCEIGGSALVGGTVLRAPEGFRVTRWPSADFSGEAAEQDRLEVLRSMLFSIDGPTMTFSLRIEGAVVPEESGTFRFGLAQAGAARLFLDGELVLDGATNPPPPGGSDFFGMASQDLETDVAVAAGRPIEVVVELVAEAVGLAGFRVAFRTPDPDRLLDRAVAAARDADVAVVVAGSHSDWETEGRDREQFGLPGAQDELIRRVAEANPRTVVVLNAGTVVDTPWAGDVAAVAQCWFGGQELGPALADVLTGAAEPGGRLATTVPVHLEHTPSHGNFPGENGRVLYGEGLLMGYRGFEHRRIEPRFPFGHGLGYTSFELGEPRLSAPTFRPGGTLTVTVPVTNTGDRPGASVVQLYVAPEAPRLLRPPKELKAFAKVRLDPGESTTVDLVLDDRSFAYWDPGQPGWEAIRSRAAYELPGRSIDERRSPGWQVDPGRYGIVVGRSSTDLTGRTTVEVEA